MIISILIIFLTSLNTCKNENNCNKIEYNIWEAKGVYDSFPFMGETLLVFEGSEFNHYCEIINEKNDTIQLGRLVSNHVIEAVSEVFTVKNSNFLYIKFNGFNCQKLKILPYRYCYITVNHKSLFAEFSNYRREYR